MWKQSNGSFYHRKMKNDDRTKQDLGIDFRAQSAPLFLSYWPSSSSSFLDLGIYFRATATEEVLGILVVSSIVLLPTLLLVAIIDHRVKSDNSTSNGTFSDLGKLSMGHAYKHVSDLRVMALMSLVVKPEQFVVLVRGIPPTPNGETTKEQVDSNFQSIYPDKFYRSMLVTNNKEVNKIWKEPEGYRKKLVLAKTVYAKSQTVGNHEGARPMNRTGFLGLIGQKLTAHI
ncbi:hypothetical protein Nepgr_026577 [Nepenthes gracilis]|uniref:CSC1/OSCA1-like cytosolic domain-containing protein n=1 Tax=Nepenthes gracilis TaxID=150966 RepID=A0AAD3Y276_NEPGR|nr:hypothetical protein Nepgr_026577 [Nepenthes gracilis]